MQRRLGLFSLGCCYNNVVKGRAAYGTLASNAAATLDAAEPVIVFDITGIAPAFADALGRRARGEHFYTRPILPNEESIVVDSVLEQVLPMMSSPADQRRAVEMAWLGTLEVNKTPLRNMRVYGDQLRIAARTIVDLSDAAIASSEAERRRIQHILRTQPPARVVLRCDPFVPVPPPGISGTQSCVLIWAPSMPGNQAAAFALLMGDIHAEKLLVSSTPPSLATGATWVPPDRASEALLRARVIVDTCAYGADTARALTQWNAALVADAESGATEAIDHVRCYSRQIPASLAEAVYAALGSAVAAPTAETSAILTPPSIELLNDGPLVSIIVPTFDRPAKLRDALESIERQTYANIEGIVVNDGGPPIDELVAQYPRSRLITMAENNPPVSANTAFKAAKGEYVGILCDDDILFPHHVASLVTALERAHANVAHGNVLTAYLRGDDEAWLCYGYDYQMHRSVEYQNLLANNHLGTTSVLFRRKVLTEGYILDERVPYCRDYALWLRLASKHDFIHIESITSCYTIRNAGAAQISTMWKDRTVEAFKTIYAMYPVDSLSTVAHTRSAVLERLLTGDSGFKTDTTIGIGGELAWPPWNLLNG